MYKVNIAEKTLLKLASTSFSSQKIMERYDIQEWIEKCPEILGEDLLIISKEHSLPTGSRLDLLALDKKGKLVIIELKRDDSGKNADWQAIKYASFCSNFLVEEVSLIYSVYLNIDQNDAKRRIEEFIEGDFDEINQEQRIILVSVDFHSDVISAVLWLRDYGLDVECLRLRPFADENGQLFIHPDKIIPIPEAKDYILKKEIKRKEVKRHPVDGERGNLLESVIVKIDSGKFRLERYDSTTIMVFNLESSVYVTARPILREINVKKDLKVNTNLQSGNEKNTRTLGRDIIQQLIEQKKIEKTEQL